MSDLPPPSSQRPPVLADDQETARWRMRHLAPWHVAPMPPIGRRTVPLPAPSVGVAGEARRKHLALQLLALQMGRARPASALR